MNLFQLISYVLYETLGIELLPANALFSFVQNSSSWYELLIPEVFLSILFYISLSIGIYKLCIVLPYRYLKKILKYPSRKGSEI